VKAVDWNLEQRRDTGLGIDDLGQWLLELSKLSNELRREFHLLTLLSGSRPAALKRIKLTDINFQDRLLHIPEPKGGAKKAFDIPLSPTMIRCIIRAIRLSRVFYPEQAATWVFAADSASGHIEAHKEDRVAPVAERKNGHIIREGVSLSKFGNDLRQSYRTLAQVAGVAELDAHLLMNHSLPGVNAGYITRDKLSRNHLRAQQQRISGLVEEVAARLPQKDISRWLRYGRPPPPVVAATAKA
jgi:integrase